MWIIYDSSFIGSAKSIESNPTGMNICGMHEHDVSASHDLVRVFGLYNHISANICNLYGLPWYRQIRRWVDGCEVIELQLGSNFDGWLQGVFRIRPNHDTDPIINPASSAAQVNNLFNQSFLVGTLTRG